MRVDRKHNFKKYRYTGGIMKCSKKHVKDICDGICIFLNGQNRKITIHHVLFVQFFYVRFFVMPHFLILKME